VHASPDPIEAIKFRMERQGLTRRDLEPLIGTRARVIRRDARGQGCSGPEGYLSSRRGSGLALRCVEQQDTA
jgi:hypothetical protein